MSQYAQQDMDVTPLSMSENIRLATHALKIVSGTVANELCPHALQGVEAIGVLPPQTAWSRTPSIKIDIYEG